ncbi:MAG: TonB C-terminal domain-containing protein [Acidobacteriia bacterium]|nr:TonB C-terminal domain-containing protein [Terriglobia bacterium]
MHKTEDIALVLLLEKEQERARRRESVLVSVILHLVFIILIVVNPKFLSYLTRKAETVEKKQEVTELFAPPMEQPKPQSVLPPPPVRGHIAPPPPTTPNPGKMAAPPLAKLEPPKPDVAQQTKPPAPAEQKQGGVQTPPRDQAKLNAPKGPALEDLNSQQQKGKPSLKLDLGESAGKSVEEAMRQAAKNRGSGPGSGSGEGIQGPLSNQRNNLSIDEPIILSDTYGVDLDPYLRRIYFIVRANWYSLIPEVIYTGRKGRVTIVFDIQKNGKILNMNVVARSGTAPYDTAAVGSLNLSTPLPALPNYFPGDHITLQYTYLYNLAPRT